MESAMDLQHNQKGKVELGVAEVHLKGVQYVGSCKVEQMSLSQALQSKAKERMGL